MNQKRLRGGRNSGGGGGGGGGGGNGGGGGGGGGGRRSHAMGSNRNYDSNGPDVKIRGTASHIYERYCQLARDASSAGDRVAAENYLQHAEHYYRIMLANGLIQPKQNGQGQGDGNVAEGEAQGDQPFGTDGHGSGEQGDSQADQPVIAEAPQPEEIPA